MYEPSAIYSTSCIIFDRNISPTQNVILSQGRSALRTTVEKIDVLHEVAPPDTEEKIYTDHKIPPILHDLCYHAGLASTILFNDNQNKGRLESNTAYTLRHERVRYVNSFCQQQSINTPTLTNRSIRNSLTHIDEKLADILTQSNNIAWFIDTARTSRNQFTIPEGLTAKHCRSYISNEDRIVHLDQELNISQLRIECVKVLAVVFGIDLVGSTLQNLPKN